MTTPAQRRRARKKARVRAKRELERLAAEMAGDGPAPGGKSRQAEVGAQMAINAAERLKARFAKKTGERLKMRQSRKA